MALYDVGVIGIGRVGLPLALSLCSKGLKVLGLDINNDIIDKVNHKIMPFKEEGYDEILGRVDFKASNDIADVKDAENIIITVGTPLLAHIETDLSQLKKVLNSIKPHIAKGHNIILRSTVAPRTTEFVKKYLELSTGFKVGIDIFLSFCPERIAEGRALIELEELPQIIGSEDGQSAAKAEKIFSNLTKDIMHTDYISAELVKLFNNISRYIHFAVSNQFAIIADSFGADIYDIIYMSNYKYPRGVIPKPGFTAGTCLRKDFGMINENVPYTDLLLSAWKVNEFMPKFLVDNLKHRTDLYNKIIAVLGYSFKNDTDDTRDSLVPKLIRYLEREAPAEIRVHDPFLPEVIDELYVNSSLDETVQNADVIYFAINHTSFKTNFLNIYEKCRDNCWFVDLWNVSNTGRIFFKKDDFK
jgi:UDP-N-acetyl-D-mannosaminuronic acid dehydrogenase